MPAHRTIRLLVMVALSAGALFVFATPAHAHESDESYLFLDVGDDDLRGTIQLPYDDIREVFGLELDDDSLDDFRAEIEANLAALQAYAESRTSIGADGLTWDLLFTDYDLLGLENDSEEGARHLILPYVVDLPTAEVPQLIEVGFTPFLEEIPGRNNLAVVINDWQRGVIGEEANVLVVFDADSPDGVIDLGDSSQWKNFDASIDLGIDHIRTGPDHIFFILALLLPSVLLLRAGRWRPAEGFGGPLIRVLIVATMFTLAHSITFTLAGLDLIPSPPSKLTETLIAASIVIAALHNLRPVLGHREWLIAFVFGLFHGLGFAGFVEDLEITQTTKLVSLLGRNLGIEIGQAVIIVIVFPTLYLLSRTRYYRAIFTAATLLLASVSTLWVFERLFEQDFGFNDTIDKIVEWPRIFYLCILATVAAGALVWYERQQGRIPSDGGFGGDEPADSERETVGAL